TSPHGSPLSSKAIILRRDSATCRAPQRTLGQHRTLSSATSAAPATVQIARALLMFNFQQPGFELGFSRPRLVQRNIWLESLASRQKPAQQRFWVNPLAGKKARCASSLCCLQRSKWRLLLHSRAVHQIGARPPCFFMLLVVFGCLFSPPSLSARQP